MSNRGKLFVVSAPAGTGKTTLVNRLCQELPSCVRSVSCTTRPMRAGEEDGRDYLFLSEADFERRVKAGDFLEEAHVFDYRYGTLKGCIEKLREDGKHPILVIDTQGALQLIEKSDAVFIFIAPPSLDVLERRLRGRGTESEEVINKRLSWAEKELALSENYNYTVINDDLDAAYKELKTIVEKEISNA